MKIIMNCIQCKACGEVIESNSIYDFVSCSCGKCSVDGGLEYLQRVAETRDIFVEMSQFEEDWFFAGCVKIGTRCSSCLLYTSLHGLHARKILCFSSEPQPESRRY